MSGRLYALLWAKTDRVQDVPSPHSLACHSLDVAAVGDALWESVLAQRLRDRLAHAFGLANPDRAGRLLAALAGLHDFGKATPAFQFKLDNPNWRRHLAETGLRKPVAATTDLNHAFLSAFLLTRETQTLGGPVAGVLGGHHGTFPTGSALRNVRKAGERALGDAAWCQARQALLEDYLAALGLSPGDLACFQCEDVPDDVLILLAGFIIVADWIGSSEDIFPFRSCPDDLAAYARESGERVRAALKQLGWARPPGPTSESDFQGVFSDIEHPRPLQECTQAIGQDLAHDPFLALIEAPMGEGKTEAALYLHDLLAARDLSAGLYIALPTQATSNQMFRRTKHLLASRFPEAKVNLHLLHSGTVLSDRYQQLRIAANLPGEKGEADDTGAVVAEEWFVPRKRTLLAPFGVGTVDQALLAVLQTRHYYLRLFGLAGKTVVLDEVHAYDTYTSTLIDHLMRWLGALGSSVIVLSATLPSRRRRELIDAFRQGAGIHTKTEEAPYPRITAVSRNIGVARTFGTRPRKPLAIRWMEPSAPLVGTLGELLRDGGCAACICNTVSRAQQVFLELREALPDTEVHLFHARFPLGRRQEIEEAMLKKFGKGDIERPRRAVLVATQVVEQSLDLDFDVMVTDIAPVDLLLQRAGRMHRHEGRDRPALVAEPTLWIREPSMDPDGIPVFGEKGVDERVYARHVLLRSWAVFQECDCVRVPADIEALVEKVYSDSSMDELSEAPLAANAAEARETWDRMRARQTFKARDCLVPTPNDETGILQQFNMQLEEEAPDVHQSIQAATRDAGPSVSVVCLHAHPEEEAVFFDRACKSPAPLGGEMSLDQAKDLLRHSVSLSNWRVVHHFTGGSAEQPWRSSPLLRHHYLAVFRTGRYEADRFTLVFDSDLGIAIEYN